MTIHLSGKTGRRNHTMNNRPIFIGIAGESGVGKSTIASIISLYLGNDDTLRISTDDLHRWERNNPMWDTYTHLNPLANNLELGDFHITDLSNNKPIYRSVYNHATGNFDPPVRMESKKYVINEGLHAFYTDELNNIIDLKIFVDTDEELRVHWKLIRDTEHRGYKYNSVIDAINKRKNDSVIIRERQINNADVIIKLGTVDKIKNPGSKNEDIILTLNLEYNNTKYSTDNMFDFISEFMSGLNEFVKLSNSVGNDISLCQNNGGNVSIKISDSIMIVKSSGYELKNVHGLNGHSVIAYKDIQTALRSGIIKDDRGLDKFINKSITSKEHKRPSMETGFHSVLRKYVVHTHPIYINVLLCMENSRELIAEAFKDFDHTYVEYKNPGFDLSSDIVIKTIITPYCAKDMLYFLENHGLIVTDDDYYFATRASEVMNKKAAEYLMANLPDGTFEEFSLDFADHTPVKKFFYPDSALFLDDTIISKREILAAHNYIYKMGNLLGNLRYLNDEDIDFLRSMDSEIYRKNL